MDAGCRVLTYQPNRQINSSVIHTSPWWVHLVVSLPVLLVSTVLPLRPIKGWLVASQFYFKAREGRLVRDE